MNSIPSDSKHAWAPQLDAKSPGPGRADGRTVNVGHPSPGALLDSEKLIDLNDPKSLLDRPVNQPGSLTDLTSENKKACVRPMLMRMGFSR